MLRVITGNLGSGKTYYAVNYLYKYATYEKLYDVMLLQTDILLVTNIDNISVTHMKYDEFREKGLMNIEKTREFMHSMGYKRIILIIDESQRYFDKHTTADEYFFFEYSRHLGMDIFLIVQSVSALPRRMVELAEYVIAAVPRTIHLGGFRYEVLDSKTGMKYSVVAISKNQDVFKLYRSFDVEEDKSARPKAYLLRKYALGIGIVVLCFFSMTYGIRYAFQGNFKSMSEVMAEKNQRDANIPKVEKKSTGAQGVSSPSKNSIPDESKSDQDVTADENLPPYEFIRGKVNVIPQNQIKGSIITSKGTYILYK